MANRALRKTTRATFVLLLLASCAGVARAQASSFRTREATAARLSDAQVIKELKGSNEKKAVQAVHEVLARGGRMIPLLLKLKGDRRCFMGDRELGSHAGCSLRMVPVKRNLCYEWGDASTVELAAIYLIEAVYRDDLKFAQGVTLVERGPDGDLLTGRKHNGRELVARAWAAVESWAAEFGRDGLDALRAKDRPPFAGTRLDFY